MMERFTASDGRGLAYTDTGGTGPAVLCLAGLTRNRRDFEALQAALSPRFRVIRLDARGRGGSDRAEDPLAEYSIPVESRDALELVAHLGLKRVAVVGTSRGGILGMAMASGVPGLVTALVLNDIGAEIEMAGLLRIEAMMGEEVPESFEAAAARLAEENRAAFPTLSPERWLAHARALFDEGPDGAPRRAWDPHLRQAVAVSMDTGLPRVTLWPLFEGLGELPVLVIRGANSDILSAAVLDEMAVRHPRLAAVTVPDRGHAPFLDEPEAVDAILRFLGRHAQ